MRAPKKAAWQFATLVAIASVLCYALLFITLFATVGHAVAALSLLPSVLAAWMRGTRAGVLAAFAVMPLNVALFTGIGDPVGTSVVGGLAAVPAFALVAATVGYMRDAQRRVARLTFHDQTTQLPNRLAFVHEIERRLTLDGVATILLVKLEGLHDVNETFGYEVGDEILREMSRRLRLLDYDFVSRQSDRTFGVLTSGGPLDESLARSALSVFDVPFIPSGAVIDLQGHVGIARSEPNDAAAELLRRAEAALKRAAQAPARWSSAIRGEQLSNREQASRLQTVAALRSAMARDELLLHFQPVVNLKDDAVRCFEALIRWKSPDGKLVPPSAFIPLAEQTGLVVPMTDWVIDEALRQCASWVAAGHDMFVAVNVSAKSFAPSARLVEVIQRLLAAHRLPASRLGIEITETDAMIDPAQTSQILKVLKDLGVRTAVDDFGTGYSSLAYLNRLPLDAVKIDRSFIQRLLADAGTSTIVRASIDLSHALGLDAVAEGVEDVELLNRLANMGCDKAQGYLIARPMPAENVLPWLAQRYERPPVTAPSVDERTAIAPDAEPVPATILVVDDEHPLRVAAHRILSASGFKVLHAATASEAIRICAEYDGGLDLVLSDVFLTDWRGTELADRLRKIYPGMKVILMSADPAARDLSKGMSLLRKPYTNVELIAHVKGALAI